jgi:ferrochelatase
MRASNAAMNEAPLAGDLGVLLIGHGSVESVEEIPAFLAQIRRGRPTPPSIVEEVAHRWKAIGGSPLLGICKAQAAALEARLGVPVRTGMRLWKPWAREVVAELGALGAQRIVSLPLAPYSVDLYNEAAAEACATIGARCLRSAPWGETPALVDAFATEIARAIRDGAIPSGAARAEARVLLTAHSLPTRVIRSGDRYEAEVRATAAAVTARLAQLEGHAREVRVAFQSQGMDGGDWLGPNLPESFASLAASGAKDVVVCAIGFLADHTEVLFDLDVEAKAQAASAGLRMHRAASLNVAPRFIDALEAVARRAIADDPG